MAASRKRRVAILISGRGSNMASLIEAAKAPGYPAEIALVLSNRPDADGLARAATAGIAIAVVDHKTYPEREAFERALDGALLAHRVELVCLAGFMRILTPWFVERWTGRMLNIHPSLLPLFTGLAHASAGARGRRAHPRLHGAFRDAGARCGPIIAQAAVPVLAADTEGTLAARVLRQEHVIYPLALQLVASGRVYLQHGRVELEADWDEEAALVSPRAACRRESRPLLSSWPGLSWPSRPKSASCWDARHKAGHDAFLTDPRSGERGLTPLGGPELPGELRAYPLQRHAVVVEGRAAVGRDLVGAGERVDAAAIREVGVRPDRFRDQHAAPHALEEPGADQHRAARIAQAHPVAVRDRRARAASAGWIITSGRRSFARDVGVSLKVELRNCRAGLVASRNGCSSVASSIAGQWSGSAGIVRHGPIGPALGARTFVQSGLNRNFSSG